MFGHVFGNFYSIFMVKICLKAPGNCPGPFWSYKFTVGLWENQTMISGLLNVSPSPKTNYCYFRHPMIPQTNQGFFFSGNDLFAHFRIWEIPMIWKCWKRRAPKVLTFRRINSWTFWIWDPYLPESMQWAFAKCLKLWNQETLTPRNQETLKPRNQETLKPRSQETLKQRNQETDKPILTPYPSTIFLFSLLAHGRKFRFGVWWGLGVHLYPRF